MSLPEHSLPSLFPLVSYNYSLLGWDVHQKRWGGALASADIADKGVKVMVETGLWRSTAAWGAQAEPCPPPPGSPSTSCLAASGHHGSGSRNRDTLLPGTPPPSRFFTLGRSDSLSALSPTLSQHLLGTAWALSALRCAHACEDL